MINSPKKLFRKYNFHTGIRKQILRISIPALLVPIFSIGFFLSYYLLQNTYTQAKEQMDSDNYRVRACVLDCLLDINNISDDIVFDTELYHVLKTDYTGMNNISFILNSYSRLGYYHSKKAFISKITVFTSNPTIVDSRYIQYASESEMNSCCNLVYYPGQTFWTTSFLGSTVDSSELTMVRSIPMMNTDYKALLVISVSNNFLKNRIHNNQLYTSLELNQGAQFFATSRADCGTNTQSIPIDYNDPYFSTSGIYDFQNQSVCVEINALAIPGSDDVIYICTIDKNIINTLIRLLILCLSIIISSFTIPSLAIIFFTKKLGLRIDLLRSATHQASNGNYDIIDNLQGNDELSDTFYDIKHMIENVKQTEAQIYEVQIRKKEYENQQREMEFKLLTSQINPHFMYNTLETIRMIALKNGDIEVSDTVSLFGKSLHYVLENTMMSKANISREIQHIHTYLQIQQLRFADRFYYEILIPDDFQADKYEILPLLLQPIVENAIVHGIEDIDYRCKITVQLTVSNDKVIFDIIDDGKGIPNDVIEKFNSDVEQNMNEVHSSIALINIAHRIRLVYGKSYSIQIMQAIPRGTHVQITIPLIPIA